MNINDVISKHCYIMKFLHVKHTVYVDVNERAVIVRNYSISSEISWYMARRHTQYRRI